MDAFCGTGGLLCASLLGQVAALNFFFQLKEKATFKLRVMDLQTFFETWCLVKNW